MKQKRRTLANKIVLGLVIGAVMMSGSLAYAGETVTITTDVTTETAAGMSDSGDVVGNTLSVTGGNITADLYGGKTNTGNATDNIVKVMGGTLDESAIYGGYSVSGNANNNAIDITGGTFDEMGLYGGRVMPDRYSEEGMNNTVAGNRVTVDGGTFIETYIYGGSGGAENREDIFTIDAKDNVVTITGGTFTNSNVYGSDTWYGEVSGNTVTIGSPVKNKITTDDSFFDVGGGSNSIGNVKDNTVTIYGGTISRVIGGVSHWGDVVNNTVTINGGTISRVIGGINHGGDAVSNTVTINGGTIDKVYGGNSTEGNATDNSVNITGGTFDETYIYGGIVVPDTSSEEGTTKAVAGNRVTIAGGTFDNANLYGGYGGFGTDNGRRLDINIHTRDNAVAITGGIFNGSNIYGAETYQGEVSGNTLTIDGGTFGNGSVCGGYIEEGIRTEDHIVSAASGNAVIITGGTFTVGDNYRHATDVYGGCIFDGVGNVNDNVVTIGTVANDRITGDDYFDSVHGGTNYHASGNVRNNIVTIYNGNFNYVYGGDSGHGNAKGNTVNIYGGTFKNKVAGGCVWSYESIAEGNTVNITGGDLRNADVYGGAMCPGDEYIPLYGGEDVPNTLNLATADTTYSGKIGTLAGFDVIGFNSLDWSTTATITTDALQLDPTVGTKVTVGNIYATGDRRLADGSAMTLISSADDIIGDIRDTSVRPTIYEGIARVYRDAEGTIGKTDKTIDLTLGDLGRVTRNDQIDVLGRSRAAATAFVNQGDELLELTLDSLRRTETDGDLDVFAAVQGSNTDYDIAGSIDVNGWNGIVGVAKKKTNGVIYGAFFETGDGDYNIDNPSYNVRGGGEAEYNGGGIFVRKDRASGIYTEGALRIGSLSDKLDHALLSGSSYVGYDINTLYYGAHIGIGKIIPVGKNSLDVYGRYLYTHHDGESFDIGGTDVHFDSVDSQVLRIGARMNHARSDKFSLYYGAAWEYEFDGDADGRADIFGIGSQSFGGSTLIGEIGMNCRASDKWTVDLNFRGYEGQREGISGTLHLNCAF